MLRKCLEMARLREVAPLVEHIGQHDVVLDAGRAWIRRLADRS